LRKLKKVCWYEMLIGYKLVYKTEIKFMVDIPKEYPIDMVVELRRR